MALDRLGNTIASGQVYLLAGVVRAIAGDDILIVFGDRGQHAARVRAGEVIKVDDAGSGGGGGGAPVDARYLVAAADGTLTMEEVVSAIGLQVAQAADAAAIRTLLSVQPTNNPTFTGTAVFDQAGSSSVPASTDKFIRGIELNDSQNDQNSLFLAILDGYVEIGDIATDSLIQNTMKFLGRTTAGAGAIEELDLPVSIALGGSGQTTQQAAIDALTAVAAASTGQFLRKTAGGNAGWESIITPTYPLSIAQGGSGQTTAQAAINALSQVSAATAGHVLTKVGSDAAWAAPAGGIYVLPFITSGGSSTYTNQPSSIQFWGGSTSNVTLADLSAYTQVRITVKVNTPGATGAKVPLRYRAAGYSATPGDYSVIGTEEVYASLTSAGIIRSGWIDLAAGAIADNVAVGLMGLDGDGAADPNIAGVRAEFR